MVENASFCCMGTILGGEVIGGNVGKGTRGNLMLVPFFFSLL